MQRNIDGHHPNLDLNILASILGSPYFEKLPYTLCQRYIWLEVCRAILQASKRRRS